MPPKRNYPDKSVVYDTKLPKIRLSSAIRSFETAQHILPARAEKRIYPHFFVDLLFVLQCMAVGSNGRSRNGRRRSGDDLQHWSGSGRLRRKQRLVDDDRRVAGVSVDHRPTAQHRKQLASRCQCYPNPTSALLYIEAATDVRLDGELVGSNGQIVLRATDQPSAYTLNMSTLPTGVYLLRLTTTDKLQQTVFQIIKK